MRKLGSLIGIYLCLLATSLAADPTFYGPSGLITMPTAESLEYQQFNVAYDFRGASTTQQGFFKFNMGMFKNVELGVIGGAVPTEGVFINVKYFLLSDASRYPLSFAVGLQNAASQSDTSVYLVMSKKFQGGLNVHGGFNATFSTELDPSVMAGIEYLVNDHMSFLADVSGKRRQYTLNGGLRFAIYPDLSLRVSILDIGRQTTDGGTYYAVGLAYNRFM
ncbi:hypothetical protein EB093_00485 [bacterium]|nr:hypothetical protein [bacterium]